jgi:CHAT domain-containing protein
MYLAEWALERAENDTVVAAASLSLATLIAAEHGEPPALLGQIAYAEARRALHAGDLPGAEAALRQAQQSWGSIDAHGSHARTFLGLTQVLAMQGRFAEAGDAAQGAIDALQPLVESDPSARLLLSRALRNRANLLVYQEQHAAASDLYREAIVELERFQAARPPEAGTVQTELEAEFGHLALNLASAHTFLDAPEEAEALLQQAIARFTLADDVVNRGRAQTNLGRLYLRLGEYAIALRTFDLASSDLIGELSSEVSANADAELDALRQADELLLEYALAYLSLNLLPEAARSLERCERLFRATGQPYELAQCRYAQGVLRLQQGDFNESQSALDEALALYTQLGNDFWRNRTQSARARLVLAQGESSHGQALLDELLAAPEMATAAGALAWDLFGLVDVWLMRLQLWLDNGMVAEAEAAAQAVETLLGGPAPGEATALPHLALRLLHSRGRIAAAGGDDALARRHFSAAVDLLDRQRATLPLEEVRTAYLDDKMAIYSDLVVSLLASPLPSEDEVAAAFAIVERARSRALLERLLASVETPTEGESAEISEQRAALRRQLHWLYNQLLGESGNRRLDGSLSREVAHQEAAIQRLEWRSAPILAHAEPVRLAQLQEVLAPEQQALVYYFAGSEVLAFVVGREDVRVARRLTTLEKVTEAQAELRFQLGRAEMGSDYVARHHTRLMRGVQDALGRLYQLLVAPLHEHLVAEQLLLIPYGVLHLIPFHALWDGKSYWLEQVEISYVPSASIAVHKQGADLGTFERFAGFAPHDERIPQAQSEIDMAATYFAAAQCYHDEAATISNMTMAAATTDVLHLATHGLFRPDNSFFSAIKLADGWIDVREIYRLRLSARLVVLSACESGVGEVRAGDEVVGLARGFLAAGTPNLIASLWNVHDRSAADLMGTFYAVLQNRAEMPSLQPAFVMMRNSQVRAAAGGDNHPESLRNGSDFFSSYSSSVRPAAALRAAQYNALRAGEHPYYWAPFFSIG